KSEIELLRELILDLGKKQSAEGGENAQETNDSQNDIVDITETAAEPLSAQIKTLPVAIKHSTEPQGEGTKIEDFASGTVTIYNEMSYSQSLVVNTRLLTPDNVLFRIQNPVILPAGGSAEVEARADQKGEIGNIPPIAFTIPGLSGAKQKQVYGKSDEPFKGGIKVIKTLSEEDFVRAKQEAEIVLREQVLEEFNKQDIAVASSNILLDEIKFDTKNKPGEQTTKLEIAASAKARGLIFNQETLLAQAKLKLSEQLLSDQIILTYNEDSFSYEIVKIDESLGFAIIKIYLEGTAVLSKNNTLIDPRDLAGLKPEEIQNKILQNKAVQEVRVKLSPFWVGRAPRIAEKIKIVISNSQ
ncbi:MAG: hypothetical protein AAB525_04320, partial [Patescibacteria group bacterium]